MTFEMLFAYKQTNLKHYSPIAHSPLPLITRDFFYIPLKLLPVKGLINLAIGQKLFDSIPIENV